MADYRKANLNYFLEQWEKVIRWKKQCEGAHLNNIATQQDFCEAFFFNAYHLKDWLKQWFDENNKSHLKEQMNQDFKSNMYLKILGDVVNGMKHFTLNNPPKVGRQFVVVRSYSLGIISLNILIGGQQVSLDNLCNNVYKYWEDFFKNNRLDQLEHDFRPDINPSIPFD